jgi:transposase, IS30 family
MGIRRIAEQLGRAPLTVSRELRCNATATCYRPFEADRRATARRARPHWRRVETSEQLPHLVAELLAKRWSPEQISRQLRLRFPDEPAMWLCHESIYQAVYQPGSVLMRPSPLASHRRSPLRSGRDHRRAHQHKNQRRPRFERPMLTIWQRRVARGPRTISA